MVLCMCVCIYVNVCVCNVSVHRGCRTERRMTAQTDRQTGRWEGGERGNAGTAWERCLGCLHDMPAGMYARTSAVRAPAHRQDGRVRASLRAQLSQIQAQESLLPTLQLSILIVNHIELLWESHCTTGKCAKNLRHYSHSIHGTKHGESRKTPPHC
jgi:hypothetical protein